MIRPYSGDTPSAPLVTSFMLGAIQRRDGWASRTEARESFAASPFFRAWDPTALDAFVDSALYAAPDGQIRLKMPGLQEGVNFAERNAAAEVFELLPEMDARVETHWVVPEKLGPR